MQNNVFKAVVKKDKREVFVYKLASGGYNIFLGDSISVSKVSNGDHTERFSENEIELK